MVPTIRPVLTLFVLLTALTGVAYPLVVTTLAETLFPAAANGSLVVRGGVVVGSQLVGQPFDDNRYFWGRPSSTQPHPYDATASSGSNLGPTNAALVDAVRARIERLRATHPAAATRPIPIDLVTSSGSGLDPHISPAAAHYQVERVASARGLDTERVRSLVRATTESPLLGFLGEPRVHVLSLNLALDALAGDPR